jgi:hypothetical protein
MRVEEVNGVLSMVEQGGSGVVKPNETGRENDRVRCIIEGVGDGVAMVNTRWEFS